MACKCTAFWHFEKVIGNQFIELIEPGNHSAASKEAP